MLKCKKEAILNTGLNILIDRKTSYRALFLRILDNRVLFQLTAIKSRQSSDVYMKLGFPRAIRRGRTVGEKKNKVEFISCGTGWDVHGGKGVSRAFQEDFSA